MEKFQNSCDKEYMKMAMMKQEEIFREQVYELHRLYRVQKMHMKNVPRNKENEQNQCRWIKSKDKDFSNYSTKSHYMYPHPRQSLDLEKPPEEHIAKFDGDCVDQMEDECEIELTLGSSSYKSTRKVKTPLTSDSALSLSSSSTGSSNVKWKENCSRISDNTKELKADEWGLVEVPNFSPSFVNSRRNSSSDINDQSRQAKLQQPPWLFQVLNYKCERC